MSRREELEGIVRESGTLVERLNSCITRIANMCKDGHPPKMTIPVQWNDDDFFIVTTLYDAIAAQQSAQSDVIYKGCGCVPALGVKCQMHASIQIRRS